MDLQDVFISNLKRIRKEQHITQEKLADACQTDASYIGQIEIKKRFPSLALIEKIADSLHIEPYILFKDNEKSESSQFLIEELSKDITDSIHAEITKTLKEKLADKL